MNTSSQEERRSSSEPVSSPTRSLTHITIHKTYSAKSTNYSLQLDTNVAPDYKYSRRPCK